VDVIRIRTGETGESCHLNLLENEAVTGNVESH